MHLLQKHWRKMHTMSCFPFVTLLPQTLWYFFSRIFLMADSSLKVMKTKPLLLFVFGSIGSSIVSICKHHNRYSINKCQKTQINVLCSIDVKLTSPKAPKYSRTFSSVVSGLRPPTKIFLTSSFFIAMALLGSICRPSSLCSFCSSTLQMKRGEPLPPRKRLDLREADASIPCPHFLLLWTRWTQTLVTGRCSNPSLWCSRSPRRTSRSSPSGLSYWCPSWGLQQTFYCTKKNTTSWWEPHFFFCDRANSIPTEETGFKHIKQTRSMEIIYF